MSILHEFLYIDDIKKYTCLSERQIRNRVKNQSLLNQNLIKGGGRGKGGKYSIHWSILPDILKEEYSKCTDDTYQRKQIMFKSYLGQYEKQEFEKNKWKQFSFINPKDEISPESLKEVLSKLPGKIFFYSIHGHLENNTFHIHYVSDSEDTSSKELPFKAYHHCVPFNEEKKKGCLIYFTNSSGEVKRENQYLESFGIFYSK
jgi:hypothetical protein